MDDVDELEEDEFVEGDESDDMAEERLVGDTDDFLWWSLWLWFVALWLLSPPRSWLEGALALFSSPSNSVM